ncbi:hypothetical protein SERLA73DRAFT_50034 [Serpula lacrymans var. lacrymans S7.3]|uniref:4'-phosphopantetheinyl transferase domain-containing protein n=1 Tax=Serpula lacrymans var. lacrymans (strain S7.3) TaxID=936435 RepID=F8PP95_SERL3|nr:hypothetical protein SERLA73DRAFT_50034 [Serpula lacrymans var. lacrymans S7.3]
MPVHGIGVDVLHLTRISSLLKRQSPSKFALRILSTEEYATFSTFPSSDDQRRTRFLAVRWAVKEAAYKALYPVRPTWKELTYRSLVDGVKPTLMYDPGASQSPNSGGSTKVWPGKLHVSVSHDGDYVFASVLAEV